MPDIRIPGVKYGAGDYDQRAELEKSASTDRILNVAAQKAGCLRNGEQVHIHGDDKTYGETKAEQEPAIGFNFGTVNTAAEGAEKLVEFTSWAVKSGKLAEFLETSAERATLAGLPLTAYSLTHDLAEAWQKGDERSAALHKDMMLLALVTNLALPEGYRNAEVAKRPEAAAGANAPATKIATALAQQPGAKLLLQVRCDEGMHAAQQFAQSGRSLDDFMRCNESFGRRFQQDPAFRAGFDAMEWARKSGPDQLRNAMTDLRARDARFHDHASLVWSA